MAQQNPKTILFLDATNHDHSRFAEIFFNSVARKMKLPWRAVSRGLTVEASSQSADPLAITALEALAGLGVRDSEAMTRFPQRFANGDVESAQRVVALTREVPFASETLEFWAAASGSYKEVEREVMGLIARLLGGGGRPEELVQPAAAAVPAKKAPTAKVGRETAGRRGKGVTTVFDVPLDENGLKDLAAVLKQRCGTGGTVKDGRIEIQGDQRERIIAELEKLGYKTKRVGG
jgi:translation initiation factor 1